MGLRKSFRNPGMEYRGAPFWSWNDRLEDTELVRQIESMRQAGMGGFFMHSRTGLLTPYMSDEWMQHIRTCVHAAKERGMLAWLYDEDRWPSGFAGGDVPPMHPSFRAKHITWQRGKAVEVPDGGVLAVYSCAEENGQLSDFRLLREEESTPPGRITVCFLWRYDPPSPWYNGGSYLDTLNPEAVAAFLRHTYDAYAREVGEEFGKTVPGIFTDEPHYGKFFQPDKLPFTERLPEQFQKAYGYPLAEALPALFWDTPDAAAHRYRFHRLLTQMFVQSFGKQLYDWCEQHGIHLTGHYLLEDTFQEQIAAIGAAMPLYEYMQSPGIDHLGRRLPDALLARQVSSVARQMGRRRVLCETYGCSGWNISFAEQKWIADNLFVQGVTYMNQHLALYSMWGGRKRDFPPSIFYQQPWWKHYRYLSDYMARITLMLRSSTPCNELLVLHTIGSGWATFRPDHLQPCARYGEACLRVSTWLSEMQHDHDFGDETLIQKHARVEGEYLLIGQARYRLLVIPPALTLERSTVQMLREWLNAGGQVITVGETASRIEGVPAEEELATLWSHPNVTRIPEDFATLQETVDALLTPVVRVTYPNGNICRSVYVRLARTDDGALVMFLVNRALNDDQGELTVHVNGDGHLSLWKAETGEIVALPMDKSPEGAKRCNLPFGPAQSYLLTLDGNAGSSPEHRKHPAMQIDMNDNYRVERTEPNVLLLDYATLTLPGQPPTARLPMWRLHLRLAEHLGIDPDLHNSGVSLWKRELERQSPPKTCDVVLTYTFESHIDPTPPVTLVVEKPEFSRFVVNGIAVENRDSGWWLDIGFRQLDLSGTLRKGVNVIEQHLHFVEGMTLEPIMILGDFGVLPAKDSSLFVLAEEPKTITLEDWCGQGYPFYCGSMRLTWMVSLPGEAQRVVLKCQKPRAPVCSVEVNGQHAGLLAWHPYEVDITDLVHEGDNEITVEVFTSPRNLLGPLHHRQGELYGVGPESFVSADQWTDEYQFVPYGLRTPPRIVIYE
jgi:hypothetical protein